MAYPSKSKMWLVDTGGNCQHVAWKTKVIPDLGKLTQNVLL
jgi:hypothetical protein